MLSYCIVINNEAFSRLDYCNSGMLLFVLIHESNWTAVDVSLLTDFRELILKAISVIPILQFVVSWLIFQRNLWWNPHEKAGKSITDIFRKVNHQLIIWTPAWLLFMKDCMITNVQAVILLIASCPLTVPLNHSCQILFDDLLTFRIKDQVIVGNLNVFFTNDVHLLHYI